MKNSAKRAVNFLLLLAMLSLSLFLPTFATEGDEVFPEDSICRPDAFELGGGELEEGEQTALAQLNCVDGSPAEDTPEMLSEAIFGEMETLGANDEELFPENSFSAPAGDPDAGDGGDGAEGELMAEPTLRASQSSVTLKKGNSTSITFTAGGYYGVFYLQYSTNNTTSYSCSWGNWYGLSIPLKIQADSLGSGTVTVYMRSAADHRILASVRVTVTVVSPETPKLTASTTSVRVAKGSSENIYIAYSGFSGSGYLQYQSSNSSAFKCSWGSWSGNTTGFTIRGLQAGSGTVTIYLKNNSGTALAQITLSVSVYEKQTPKVTVSQSSISLRSGNSTKVTVTISGYNGSVYLQFAQSNQNAYSCTWGSWEGNSIPLTVTGQNEGTGIITIYLKDTSHTVLAQTTISPVTIAAALKPEVIASKTWLELSSNESQTVGFTVRNTSGSYYLQYGMSNTSAFRCYWNGWSGNTANLVISGKQGGSGTVTVYLKRSGTDEILDYKSVSVTVKGKSLESVGFGFQNYSNPGLKVFDYVVVPGIDRWICELMYGETATAEAVYRANMGKRGCCFGFATASGLIDVTSNTISVGSFHSGESLISRLVKSDRNASLGLTVTDFIEAMHISQCSTELRNGNKSDLDQLVAEVKNQVDNGRPVKIGVRGTYQNGEAGHAILAYDYEQTNSTTFSIKIYDSNYVLSPKQMTSTVLTVTRPYAGASYNSWSYPFTSSVTWGTGNQAASINFVTYDTYFSVWNRRGSLSVSGYNLVAARDNDFRMYSFDGALAVQYVDGVLTAKADNVYEISIENGFLEEGAGSNLHMLYVPIDLYTVKDDSDDSPIDVIIADQELLLQVQTDAPEFDLCADDEPNIANAIMTPPEGTEYSVSLCSFADGERQETKLEDVGMGEPISIALENGELSVMGAGSSALSVMNYDAEYSLSAFAGEGGTISPEGQQLLTEGSNQYYAITPNEGYLIKSVFVDGEDMGPITEYCFENIQSSHSIAAEFYRSMSDCQVTLSQTEYFCNGTERRPEVAVQDAFGNTLVENEDYVVSFADNVEVGLATVFVTAVRGGAYYGVQTAAFEIRRGPELEDASYSASNQTVCLTISDPVPASIVISAYDESDKLLAVRTAAYDAQDNRIEVEFSGEQFPERFYFKAFLLDPQNGWTPFCECRRLPA